MSDDQSPQGVDFLPLLVSGTIKFDPAYHVRNARDVAQRNRNRPCAICGWAKHMSIHDEKNIGKGPKGWAHHYTVNDAKAQGMDADRKD